jgi:hypothetical protein
MRTVAFVLHLHRLEMVIQIERLERACAGLDWTAGTMDAAS